MGSCRKLTAIQGIAYEQSGVILMARIVGYANTPITQATLSAVEMVVVDAKDGTAQEPVLLDVADVVFSTLQTGGPWTADNVGYNFRYNALAAERPQGGREYVYEFKLTPVSGEQFFCVFRIDTKELLSV